MKRWNLWMFLLLAPALCACGEKEAERPASPPDSPAAAESPVWDEMTWDDHLPLAYAQSFSVDYAPEGYGCHRRHHPLRHPSRRLVHP